MMRLYSDMKFTSSLMYDIFFFQAEDGIRDIGVTGVQTCALPIWMGSSSAAIVGGLAVARALAGDRGAALDDDRLFEAAAEAEGPPDNVAAAAYGGLTIGYSSQRGGRAVRLDVTADVAPVVFLPPEPLTTSVARGLLPAVVPHADAAFVAGRAALLVAALTGRADALLEATEDRLHQGYRAPAMPRSLALVEELRD